MVLTEKDFITASNLIGCETAVIKAVAKVEAPNGGFLPSGKPTLLFEAHIFSKFTNHKYDYSHPEISSRKWNRDLYEGGESEYTRLNLAKSLNEESALKSASYGKFQIMGFNYKACGYTSVWDFVTDMYESEGKHLLAFINFIKANKLDKHLISKNWVKFARGYNGAGYAQNNYDVKLMSAYETYRGWEEAT